MYEIVGRDPDLAGLLAIAGAEVPASLQQSALEAALSRDAVAVRQGMPTKALEYPLGFDSGALVAAGAAALVVSQPQVPFRVERLVVPSDIAGSFTIDNFRVGKNSQFASNDPVPARVFDEGAFGVRLRGDTAQVSMDVTLDVTNISGAGVRFRAAVIGTALDGMG